MQATDFIDGVLTVYTSSTMITTLALPLLPSSLSSSLASDTLLRRKINIHTKQTHKVYITSNNTSNHMVILLLLLLLLFRVLSIRNILMRI